MLSQVQLISYIINSKDYSIISQNDLNDSYFFTYKAEFNYIKNHYEQYRVVPDKLTFMNVFPEFDVIEVNEPASYLLEQLYNDYNASYLAQRFNKIKSLLENGETAEAVDYFMKSNENLHAGSIMTCTNLIEDTSRYDRYLEKTTDPRRFYLTTGFAELDAVLGGIDRENENMVIMARPGVGKTQILLYMATVASKMGLRVGIFEGEMTADKVGYRIDTYLGNIKNTSMNRGDLYIQKEYKRYIDSMKSANYGPIFVLTLDDIPSGSCTVDTLKAFVEKEKLDILLVDQYDLMDDNSKTAKTSWERVGSIAKGVKKLQVTKKIPIISVCQMTRSKDDGQEQDKTARSAGSDMISRYATIMIALEQKLKEDEHGKRVELSLDISKARDGGDHNKFAYTVDFNTGRFEYIPTENDGVTTKEDLNNLRNSYEPIKETEENVF